MITVVDYGVGNLRSVKKTLDHIGYDAILTDDPDAVARADKIVLPGVGHFSATSALEERGLRSAIVERVRRGTPFLGICVGMQWMFDGSEEAPSTAGLGWFHGTCTRFPASVKSPHVGWNSLVCSSWSRLLQGIPSGSFAYFTHSYRAPVAGVTAARTEYGGDFSAVIERDHLFGVQFHPEKSGSAGLTLLTNFCGL